MYPLCCACFSAEIRDTIAGRVFFPTTITSGLLGAEFVVVVAEVFLLRAVFEIC